MRALCVIAETWAHARLAAKPGANLTAVKTSWAHEMLRLLRIEVTVTGKPFFGEPLLLIGNHLSYLDITLLMATVPDISFVAKKELASWPLFGSAARAAGTVFVDRNNLSSRMQVRSQLKEAMLTDKRRLAIFPSGTTSLHEDVPWKRGSFRLAAETGTPLQAFRISYSPLRKAAFIGQDGFLLHLLRACSGKPIRATLEFSEPVMISDPEEARRHWQEWTREALLTPLPAPEEAGTA